MSQVPSEDETREGVDSWYESIWTNLYKGETSLNKKLAIISEKLTLIRMPFLKNKAEKIKYLDKLEDIYYDDVFHTSHCEPLFKFF
jgi:hypothetical protein